MPKRIFAWLENQGRSGAIIAITSVAGVIVAVLQFAGPLVQSEGAPNNAVTVEGDAAVATGDGDAIVVKDQGQVVVGLNEEKFAEMLDARMAELEAKLASGSGEEVTALRAQIAEVQRQRNNLQVAFKARVEELRRLRLELKALAVNVPQERLEAAQQALFKGDTKLADQLFAEIEEAEAEAIQRAAEAAFQRGKIAEDEVRWADAADHYARAATLAPDYSKLFNAREFAWRAGDYKAAFEFGEQLLDEASKENKENTAQHATALNEHALTLQTLGRYEEAEEMFEKAIEISKKTSGELHPNHAIRLNNFALLLKTVGRYDEAEALYLEAIEIGKQTIGENHPNYAGRLSNLANLYFTTGKLEKAEGLYRQAIKISKSTSGESHPEYAVHIGNLANLLRIRGGTEEAEQLFRSAIEIDKATIGENHQLYGVRVWSLAVLLADTEREEEALPLWRLAGQVFRASLGDEHPRTQKFAGQFASFLRGHDPASPDLAELEAVFGDAVKR